MVCKWELNPCQSNIPANPCADVVLTSIFHSFEAGIANAISSFKWMKNNIIYEKKDISQIELFD